MRLSLNRLLATAIIVLLTAVSTLAQDYRNGIRLGWDFRTQKFVTGGSYGRLKVLSDGRQAFVYDAAGVCMIRFRQAGTTSFFSAYTVAVPPSGSGYTNCELLELADGTLLYAYNERINGIGMKIKVKYSVNGGLSWINEQTLAEVRESDFVENEDLHGIWEPAMIQLPSGEVQLYYASEYQVPGHDQKIVMTRSLRADENGFREWEEQKVDVCYSVGYRDGMPVPLVLQNDKGIVFTIEDDGYGGGFQPGILYSSMADNWTSGIRYGDSSNRWVAVIGGEPRGGGAPYIIQLNTGETLVSTPTNSLNDLRGAPWDDMYKNRPFVYIGDENARNFCRYSIPFPFMDEPNQGGVWNSLCQIDDSTVVCVSEVHGHPTQSGLWTVNGRIMHPMTAYSAPEGTAMEQILWEPLMSDIIVGAETQAQMHVASCWTPDSLFLHFVVYDRQLRSGADEAPLWDTDGVEFYCDMLNRSTDNVPTNCMKYLVNIDGGTLVTQMTSQGWTDVAASVHGMRHVISQIKGGYTIDMALPWSNLLRLPTSKKFAAYYKLHNNDMYKSKETIHHEILSGVDEGRVRTWWQVTLGGAPDAVETPCIDTHKNDTYNLQGMAVRQPRHGIYIKGGKKVVQ